MTIMFDGTHVETIDALPVSLSLEARVAIDSMPGVLSLALDLADRKGRLDAEEVAGAMFLDKTTEEHYRYRGNVLISAEHAMISYELEGHAYIARLTAIVRDAGNHGSLTVVEHSGQKTVRSW
jgi:hypothetical protein